MKLNRTGSNWNRLERNKINENWDRLERLGITVTDLVLESGGDSNLEVVQARGGERVLNDRLDKFDEMFSGIKNQIEQIGSMSPRESFDTLTDLEDKFPNGSDGIFLVRDSGYWYYWDGIEWVAGGVYQATPWGEFMTEQDEEWVV